MPETEKGPLLTDETFFHSCLDLNRPEMREVRHFAENHDYGQARSALAASQTLTCLLIRLARIFIDVLRFLIRDCQKAFPPRGKP